VVISLAFIVALVALFIAGSIRFLRWFSKLTLGHKLAVVGIAVPLMSGIVGATYVLVKDTVFNESNLEIVDATFTKETGEATTLDVKVRNTGKKVAYLKEARFEINRVWQLESGVYPYPVRITKDYDATLVPDGAPYTKIKKLSQGIGPNKVDRFTFTFSLSNDARWEAENIQYVFLMDLALVSDEDNKVATSDDLLFVRDTAWGYRNYFFPKSDHSYWFVTLKNQRALGEIRRIEGPKSKSLKKLIQAYSRRNP
jgi:hypothetical protein